MTQYQMPVRAIKNILKKELEERKNHLVQVLHSAYVNDSCKEMIYIANEISYKKIEECHNYDELDELISFLGYRMSLDEWISSL